MFTTDATQLERLLNEKLDALFGVGNKLLTVARPSEREIEISANVSDLETAITQLAGREAGKQGVTVEDVRLNFRQIDQRSLKLEANVRAKKMFFAATIRITGRLEIDQDLTATMSDLSCTGDGTIGSMACGFLAPQLAKLNGRTFPLAGLNLGDRALRDVRLAAGDKLSVTAEIA
jgi:hypothetical protein